MSDTRPMTRGEYRVGVSFNLSSNPKVDSIKAKAAALIDELLDFGDEPSTNAEAKYQALEGARKIEDAAMNGVKAVTKGPEPTR